MPHPCRALLCACALVLSVRTLAAEETHAPYLAVTFEALARENGEARVLGRDARVSRLLALRLAEGAAPTPFLSPGPFRATWEGFLDVEFFEEFTFTASGRGSLEVEIDGKLVLKTAGEDLSKVSSETIELEGGKHPLVARYESPASGDAVIRLGWASFDFPHGEPLSPTVLSHDPRHEPLQVGAKLRRGRELLATYRCLECHQPAGGHHGMEATGMPDLDLDAPSLVGIGTRLHAGWLARWIDHPRAVRADANMPRLFQGPGSSGPGVGDSRSADVAAYLATLKEEADAPTSDIKGLSDNDTIERGAGLFSSLGCVACHVVQPPAQGETDEYDRLSLAHVAAKWKPASLVDFLKQPERLYPWIRMPNFHLSDGEAIALGAFLLGETAKHASDGEPLSGDPARGRKLLETTGCLNCHEPRPEVNTYDSPALSVVAASSWDRGCASADETRRGRAPSYAWLPGERDALRVLIAAGTASLERRSLPEFAERQFRALRCWACHTRDGAADVWANLQGKASPQEFSPVGLADGEETAVVVENRPNLTWLGEKLRPEWMARFLGGDITHSVRPWFSARMPKFAARAELLSQGIALAHGFPEVSPPREAIDDELAAVGKGLIQKGRFECVACHDVGDTRANAVFDAKGTNFKYVTQRLRKSFYHRWMLNPLRVSPETKMPSFASEGRSPFDVFDHDGPKQFEAIWHFFRQLELVDSSK